MYVLDGLTQAMRQATSREKAAKIAEKDPFGPVDEQLDRSAASEAVNTDAMAQVRVTHTGHEDRWTLGRLQRG